jgi:hypothetical protein
MITLNQYFAGGIIIALYVFGYYFGKEVGYGKGYVEGWRDRTRNYDRKMKAEIRDY